MPKTSLLTLIAMALLLIAYDSSGQNTYAHLPQVDQAKEYFREHKASLDMAFELYAANENINWVECDSDGLYRVTSFTAGDDFEPSAPQNRDLREVCADLQAWLIQRVESGVSVHWKNISTEHRRFRIELFRTDHSFEDTCFAETFEHSISSCMLPLDTRWGARYFWLPHN